MGALVEGVWGVGLLKAKDEICVCWIMGADGMLGGGVQLLVLGGAICVYKEVACLHEGR